ncbi:MAG: STM4015 family protein [Pirellulaceae bacterium]
MSSREFHFVSGGSSKFWRIDVSGNSHEVTYGKIGTGGTKQSKSFADATAAQKAADKLIESKTSKGYVEVTKAGKASKGKKTGTTTPSAGGGLSELFFATTQSVNDMAKLKTFIGKKVVNFTSPKSIKKADVVYRINYSWDGEGESNFGEMLMQFLDSDAPLTARGFVIGSWSDDGPEPADPIVAKLVEYKHKFPELTALFFGDIEQEESEISWIEQCDMTPLLKSFPKLELLRVRGGTGLHFKGAKHDCLRALGVEAGGLPRDVVGEICKAKFPNLEYLELWLGTPDYGGDTQVNDLQPILKGKLFPKLKYLGLRNAEIANDIAGVIINSPIIKQLETLDLSLGTLTDEGAQALLKLPQDGKLKRLDVHHHFLSKPMMKQLKALPFTVNVADQQEPDDWGDGEMRFVAIGE